jgi:hypothetical protein
MCAISSTARSKASWFACDGLVVPLTLRTYCSAAARTSSVVAGGSKLFNGRMLRHMQATVGRPRHQTHGIHATATGTASGRDHRPPKACQTSPEMPAKQGQDGDHEDHQRR